LEVANYEKRDMAEVNADNLAHHAQANNGREEQHIGGAMHAHVSAELKDCCRRIRKERAVLAGEENTMRVLNPLQGPCVELRSKRAAKIVHAIRCKISAHVQPHTPHVLPQQRPSSHVRSGRTMEFGKHYKDDCTVCSLIA
jgi:hypothetical protein